MPAQGRSWPVLGWLTIVSALVTPAAFGDPATFVAAGTSHSCAVTSTGAVYCWGQNSEGQLGDGSLTPRSTPVAVGSLGSGVVAVTAGNNHSCALT